MSQNRARFAESSLKKSGDSALQFFDISIDSKRTINDFFHAQRVEASDMLDDVLKRIVQGKARLNACGKTSEGQAGTYDVAHDEVSGDAD